MASVFLLLLLELVLAVILGVLGGYQVCTHYEVEICHEHHCPKY